MSAGKGRTQDRGLRGEDVAKIVVLAIVDEEMDMRHFGDEVKRLRKKYCDLLVTNRVSLNVV